MEKKSKSNKINAWIKKEYDRETREIEDSLSSDGSFDPDRVNSEELFRRIQAQINEQEEQKKEQEAGPQKSKGRLTGYKVRKWAALFCVAIIGVFLASMTSEANRSYLMYKMQYLVGKEMLVNEGNEGNMADVVNWQKGKYDRQETEEKLGIPVPTFWYILEGDADAKYNIQSGDAVATAEYQCDNYIVNLRMVNKNKADVAGTDFQGRIIKELNLKNGTITMTIMEVKDQGDEEVTLVAQWEYQEGYYQLSGKVEENEFIEILKSILY